MTEKKLRMQVSDAGRHFIDVMIQAPYKKWFDTQTIINDERVEYLISLIDHYNTTLKSWIKGGTTNEATGELVKNYFFLFATTFPLPLRVLAFLLVL